MIYANTDPSVHGAGSRFLAHIAAMNSRGPCSPADTWTWLYPPGRPEETEALRCGYLWSQIPRCCRDRCRIALTARRCGRGPTARR